MKRSKGIIWFLVVLVLILTLSGCKKKNQDIIDPVNNPAEDTEDIVNEDKTREEIMEEFIALINNKALDLVVDYVDRNIKNLSSIEGDKMVLNLQAKLEGSIDPLTEETSFKDFDGELMDLAGTELFFPKDKVKDIKDENLRKRIEKLFNNKYKLINMEGQFYPIVDYEAFKAYNPYVSDEIKDYIALRAEMSNEPMAIDGGLRLSYDGLADRIIKAESHIKKYSQGQKYEEVLGYYKNWLGLYLTGLPNTPIENHQTKKIYEDVLESYRKVSKVKDYSTSFVVKKYIDIIEKNNEIINQSIKDKGLELVEEAISLLKTSK